MYRLTDSFLFVFNLHSYSILSYVLMYSNIRTSKRKKYHIIVTEYLYKIINLKKNSKYALLKQFLNKII